MIGQATPQRPSTKSGASRPNYYVPPVSWFLPSRSF